MTIQLFPPVKAYWLREEIPIADELLSLAPALTKEFLAYHEDFLEGDFAKCKTYVNLAWPDPTIAATNRPDAWKTDSIKYVHKDAGISAIKYFNDP